MYPSDRPGPKGSPVTPIPTSSFIIRLWVSHLALQGQMRCCTLAKLIERLPLQAGLLAG